MWDDFKEMTIAIVFVLGATVATVAFVIVCVGLPISSRRAKIINKACGTQYTAMDVFCAGSVIEKMIIGNKVRLQVNDER